MRFAGYLRVLGLSALVGPWLLSQGLNTTAKPDDWEEINFEFNSSVLTDGYPSLLRLADLLKAHPDYRVKLDGYTDQIGGEKYNQALAQKRANTVRDFLVKYGAAAGQVSATAYGKSNPKVQSTDKNARFMNRRVSMTVTDGTGKVISAGGVGDALNAMTGGMSKKCCEDILKRLDRLDEIADLLRKLTADNDALRKELAEIRARQGDLDSYVRQAKAAPGPQGPPGVPGTPATPAPVTTEPERQAKTSPLPTSPWLRYSSINMNVGADNNADFTFSGQGRLFIPAWERAALQFQGEYMYYRDRQEGQFDFGLVERFTRRMQAGAFGSFKYVSLANGAKSNGLFADMQMQTLPSSGTTSTASGIATTSYDPNMPIGSGLLGQASGTVDYLFSRGRVGAFGSMAFLNNAVIGRTALTQFLFNEFYLKAVNQAGLSTTVALFGPSYLEANIGYLSGQGGINHAGGSARFVYPVRDHFAFTVEGGMNETLVSTTNNGRIAGGIQFGNFMRPKDYLPESDGHLLAAPVDIPRVRYELLARRVRTGNSAPVAEPDQIGIAAGTITLNGSGSFDPEGDPITFQWTQVAGPSVSISGQNTAVATFVAGAGQTYAFRLTVTDDRGAQGIARTSVTTTAPKLAKITRFQASPSSIKPGQSATLDWQVFGADSVSISGIGSVSANGSQQVSPTQTTTYVLTAHSAAGDATASVTVAVGSTPFPSITACQVQPTAIKPGGVATIFWATQYANSVTITPGIGSVEVNGSRQVSPSSETTYTITATGANNAQVSCTVTVNVKTPTPPPTGALQILSFSASPSSIFPGEPTTLQWQVTNADKVTISDIGQVDLSGQYRIPALSQDKTYVLTATSGSVTKTASLSVRVNQPSLANCQASPSTLAKPGDPSILSWSVKNADRITISPYSGPPPALNGTATVNPAVTTTYTLTAVGPDGATPASCTVTVSVPNTPSMSFGRQ